MLHSHRIGLSADFMVYSIGKNYSQLHEHISVNMFAKLTSSLGDLYSPCIASTSIRCGFMPDQFSEELGRRIRAARQGKITQATLAARIGLSRTAVTNIECGRQRLLVDQLVAIAAAIGVPTSELLPQSATGLPTVAANDARITAMPTVQRWVAAEVRKIAPGGRR